MSISLAFSNYIFLIRKNYETPEYILLSSMFATPIFDGAGCILQDTRSRQEYPVSFYKGSTHAGTIFQTLMLDIYGIEDGIEGFPVLPAPAARILGTTITEPNAAANVSLQIDVSDNVSGKVNLYTSTAEDVAAIFKTFLEELGLAGNFSFTISAIVTGEAIRIAATCTDCWAGAMTLTLINGKDSIDSEFQVD